MKSKKKKKSFPLKLQASKVSVPKADSEAVKAKGLSYFVTLAVKESVSLGFINNSFAASLCIRCKCYSSCMKFPLK